MVRRADAPPPGWYPDPTGGSGLWWWDGLDWTTHRRPPPSTSADHDRPDLPPAPSSGGRGSGGAGPTAQQLRDRSTSAVGAARASEAQVEAAVAEARRVARREVERAVGEATRQFEQARARWLPRVDDYVGRARRWVRILIVLAFLAVLASAWLNATAQVGLLEWLGQRIDAATAGVAPVALVRRPLRWPPTSISGGRRAVGRRSARQPPVRRPDGRPPDRVTARRTPARPGAAHAATPVSVARRGSVVGPPTGRRGHGW